MELLVVTDIVVIIVINIVITLKDKKIFADTCFLKQSDFEKLPTK